MQYNDDHAKLHQFVWLYSFFAEFHFKTSLHLLKNIELVLLVYKKSEIDYKGQDTTLWLLKHERRYPIPSLAH